MQLYYLVLLSLLLFILQLKNHHHPDLHPGSVPSSCIASTCRGPPAPKSGYFPTINTPVWPPTDPSLFIGFFWSPKTQPACRFNLQYNYPSFTDIIYTSNKQNKTISANMTVCFTGLAPWGGHTPSNTAMTPKDIHEFCTELVNYSSIPKPNATGPCVGRVPGGRAHFKANQRCFGVPTKSPISFNQEWANSWSIPFPTPTTQTTCLEGGGGCQYWCGSQDAFVCMVPSTCT